MKSVWAADPSGANQSLSPRDGESELKELVLHIAANMNLGTVDNHPSSSFMRTGWQEKTVY